VSTLLRYGFFAFPAAVSLLLMQIYLPTYLAEEGYISLTAIGVVLLLARLVDTFTDPLIGYLSDRTPQRFGRRRIWIVVGTPIFLGVFYILLMGPKSAIALLVLAALWYTVGTCLIVPYYTWGAEIEEGYNAHNRYAAARVGFGLLGSITALVLPAVMIPDANIGATLQLNYMLAGFAFLVGIILLLTVKDHSVHVSKGLNIIEAFSIFEKGSRFNKLLFSQFLNGTANALPASLFLFFATYILKRPDLTGPLLVLYFITAAISTPLWVYLSKFWTKEQCWRWAMIVAGAVFLFTFFVNDQNIWLFFLITFVTGIMAGADLSLPASMLADLIDHDEHKNHKRRPGIFFALWGMVSKLTFAVAIGIAFPILGASVIGGPPSDALVDKDWLITLYAMMPATLKLLSVWSLWSYKLTKDEHEAVITELHERRAH